MNEVQKNQIVELIETEKNRLGSFSKVSKKCDVSAGTISAMANGNWELISLEMWSKVGKACGWRGGKWVVVPTITNYKLIEKRLTLSKEMGIFTPISDKAGSGKTATLKRYSEINADSGVFYIQAWEWTGRRFLVNLCQSLGIDQGRGYLRMDDLLKKVIRFFHDRSETNPQLIIDEADKLRPSALRLLIPMFNELEDILSVVISGTENLQKEIKTGVKFNRKGYDEIDSRFGRTYLQLVGATKKDVIMICSANGVEDTPTIDKIWKDSNKERLALGNDKNQFVITDLRRLKRLVQREIIKLGA